jgi:hypothetical protein
MNPLQWPPPVRHFIRWIGATLANIAHFDHGTHVFLKTQLHPRIAEAWSGQDLTTWGEFLDFVAVVGLFGPIQLGQAAWSYPLAAAAVIWWVVEVGRQVKFAKSRLRRFRRMRRCNPVRFGLLGRVISFTARFFKGDNC